MNKILVLCGDGLNCEKEMNWCFQQLGQASFDCHVNKFLQDPSILHQHDMLVLPGGFSFGDDWGSGQLLASKLKKVFANELQEFIQKKLVLGICNGFQVLCKLGAFGQSVDLVENRQKHFMNKWVELKVQKENLWTHGMSSLRLPIRHGEGQVVAKERPYVSLSYKEEVNGSWERAAGLLDETGHILGLMPHPEAAFMAFMDPQTPHQEGHGDGYTLLKNAVNFLDKGDHS